MRTVAVIILVSLLPAAVRAQQSPPPSNDPHAESPPPPPLVDAPKAEQPTATTEQGAPTPPPPGYVPQGNQQVPYPYSPYGQKPEAPGPEIGLMLTESAFGMLTAAGTSLLTWYLLLKPLGSQIGTAAPESGTIYNILFVLAFAAVPMAVSQTELSLANGSRYYFSESWPSALSGLAAQAAVIGLYYLARPVTRDSGEAMLLIGTIVGVPLVEMAVINLTKQPRSKMPGGFYMGSLLTVDDEGEMHAGLPLPAPTAVLTSEGSTLGVGFSLLRGRF